MDSWSGEACNTLVKKVQVCTVCTVLLGLRTGFFCKFFSLKVKKIVQMSYLSCYWWNWYFRNVVKFPPPWSNMLTLAHLKFCTDITFLSTYFFSFLAHLSLHCTLYSSYFGVSKTYYTLFVEKSEFLHHRLLQLQVL